MHRSIFRAAFCFMLCACHTHENKRLPYFTSADFTPHWLTIAEVDTVHTIPDFNFTDQRGHIITRQSCDDKIVVVDFFFTRCPGICRRLTNSLSAVQAAYKNDDNVILLSHSVTPDADSVPVLAKYAAEHGIINTKWHLLTGERSNLYAIARKAYFADEDMGWKQDSTTFLHTENVLLIDKDHHIRGIYKGTIPSEINDLIADIKILEKEK